MKQCSSAACATVTKAKALEGVIVGSTLHNDETYFEPEEWWQFLRDVKAGKWDDVLPDPAKLGSDHLHRASCDDAGGNQMCGHPPGPSIASKH